MKIDFPIYVSHFPLKFAFLRNVKIDFRIVELFGGVNFWKNIQYNNDDNNNDNNNNNNNNISSDNNLTIITQLCAVWHQRGDVLQ